MNPALAPALALAQLLMRGIAGPSAGAERHAWAVVEAPPLGVVLLHLPAADQPGTIRPAATLATLPDLMAASGSRVLMFFRTRARALDAAPSWLVRSVHIDSGSIYVGPQSMPPLTAVGELIAAAALEEGAAALVRSTPGARAELMLLERQGWKRLELPPDRPRAGLERLMSLGGSIAYFTIDFAGQTARRFSATRADHGIEWTTAPAVYLSGAATEVLIGGSVLYAARADADRISVWEPRSTGVRPVGSFETSRGPRLIAGDFGVVQLFSSPTRRAEISVRALARAGTVLHDGPARTPALVSAQDLGTLLMILTWLLTAALAFVLKWTELPGDAVRLPEGCALASPGRRSLAGLIDLFIGAAPVCWALGANPWSVWIGLEGAPAIAACLLSSALIAGAGEALASRSIGKLIVGCRVLMWDGRRVPMLRAIARNFLRWGCPPIGLWWIIQPPHRAGGLLGTMVVRPGAV